MIARRLAMMIVCGPLALASAGCGGPDSASPPALPARVTNPTCLAPARPVLQGLEGLPAKLSATGCFDRADATKPVPALIPYAVNVPLWADGADKDRWLALPDDTTIVVDPDGDWHLPPGAVLIKTFRFQAQRLETRFFVHHMDGQWSGYTYAWNQAGTDADLLDEGRLIKPVGEHSWFFPSRADCMKCHTKAAGFSLGLETAQLDRKFTYPGTSSADQLGTLTRLGLFASPPGPAARLDTEDTTLGLDRRARAYLHANCANCHQPGVGNSGTSDLRFATALGATKTCDEEPLKGSLGLGADYKIIAKGDPDKSMLVVRMRELGSGRMPELGSLVVDTAAVDLLSNWIRGLTSCQ